MALPDKQVQAFAARLDAARRTQKPIAALTEGARGMTLEDGYRIQRAQMRARVHAGERVVGWKVGLTSAAPRAQLGIDEPICGFVAASVVYADGAAIETGRLIAPGAEAEIAFLIRGELAGPGVTMNTALLAIEGALPALEIVDSRYREWKFKAPDLAADNAAQAGIVVGGRTMALADLDLPLEGLVWEQNGQVVATATGAEVSGTPLTSVVWLANKLAEWGLSLHPGDIVLAGAVAKILRPRAGESVRARFTHLGSVSARFV